MTDTHSIFMNMLNTTKIGFLAAYIYKLRAALQVQYPQTSMETALQKAGIPTTGDDAVSVSGASTISDITSHMGGNGVDPYSNI